MEWMDTPLGIWKNAGDRVESQVTRARNLLRAGNARRLSGHGRPGERAGMRANRGGREAGNERLHREFPAAALPPPPGGAKDEFSGEGAGQTRAIFARVWPSTDARK